MTKSKVPASFPHDELRQLIRSAIESNKQLQLTISFVGQEQNGKRLVRGRLLFGNGSLDIETSATCYEDVETTVRAGNGVSLFLFGAPAEIEATSARNFYDELLNGSSSIDLELVKEQASGVAFTFKSTGDDKLDVMLVFN
jgi:hypothetical protein